MYARHNGPHLDQSFSFTSEKWSLENIFAIKTFFTAKLGSHAFAAKYSFEEIIGHICSLQPGRHGIIGRWEFKHDIGPLECLVMEEWKHWIIFLSNTQQLSMELLDSIKARKTYLREVRDTLVHPNPFDHQKFNQWFDSTISFLDHLTTDVAGQLIETKSSSLLSQLVSKSRQVIQESIRLIYLSSPNQSVRDQFEDASNQSIPAIHSLLSNNQTKSQVRNDWSSLLIVYILSRPDLNPSFGGLGENDLWPAVSLQQLSNPANFPRDPDETKLLTLSQCTIFSGAMWSFVDALIELVDFHIGVRELERLTGAGGRALLSAFYQTDCEMLSHVQDIANNVKKKMKAMTHQQEIDDVEKQLEEWRSSIWSRYVRHRKDIARLTEWVQCIAAKDQELQRQIGKLSGKIDECVEIVTQLKKEAVLTPEALHRLLQSAHIAFDKLRLTQSIKGRQQHKLAQPQPQSIPQLQYQPQTQPPLLLPASSAQPTAGKSKKHSRKRKAEIEL